MLTGLVAGTVFAGMSSEGFDRLSQPHFLSDLQFPGTATAELWFGALAVAASLGSIVVTGLLGRRLDARKPRRVGLLLVAVQAAMAVGLIWFGLTGDFWTAVILYLLVALLRNTAGPILSVWLISGTTPESRATVFSIQAQADALGQIAGGPPAGLAAQHRSIGAGIATSGVFLLPAVALFGVRGPGVRAGRAGAVVRFVSELGALSLFCGLHNSHSAPSIGGRARLSTGPRGVAGDYGAGGRPPAGRLSAGSVVDRPARRSRRLPGARERLSIGLRGVAGDYGRAERLSTGPRGVAGDYGTGGTVVHRPAAAAPRHAATLREGRRRGSACGGACGTRRCAVPRQ